MSIAEALGRLGASAVTWLCVYAWLIWTATLRVAGCETSGDDLWAVVLGFGTLVSLLSPALGLTRPIADVHAILRHFAWPLLILAPLALQPVLTAWSGATVNGNPLCPSAPAAAWHPWWAPAQTLLMVVSGLGLAWSFRRDDRVSPEADR